MQLAARPRQARTAAVLSDPATAATTIAVADQVFSFISTLTGFAAVTLSAQALSVTQGTVLATATTASDASPATAASAVGPAAEAAAPAAAAAPPAQAAAAAVSVAVDDIRAELQEAAAAAVAAIQTEAAAAPAPRPAPAKAASAAPAASGLTADEATRQVQEWITAWGAKPGELSAPWRGWEGETKCAAACSGVCDALGGCCGLAGSQCCSARPNQLGA